MPQIPRLQALPAAALPLPLVVETAQRFLASAYDSVESVLTTLDTVRVARGARRGRLTSAEEDLLRAAIVFTGAGLDATLKQLIHDTVPHLLGQSVPAHNMFEGFAARQLGSADAVDKKRVARYLVAQSPRAQLIEDYVYELTGSSLQSAEQVELTARALGIADDNALLARIRGLRPLFVARNEVSHELDLQRPEQAGVRTRRSRPLPATTALCSDGLEVAQLMVNAVANLLRV
jgi:hypothetical protein